MTAPTSSPYSAGGAQILQDDLSAPAPITPTSNSSVPDSSTTTGHEGAPNSRPQSDYDEWKRAMDPLMHEWEESMLELDKPGWFHSFVEGHVSMYDAECNIHNLARESKRLSITPHHEEETARQARVGKASEYYEAYKTQQGIVLATIDKEQARVRANVRLPRAFAQQPSGENWQQSAKYLKQVEDEIKRLEAQRTTAAKPASDCDISTASDLPDRKPMFWQLLPAARQSFWAERFTPDVQHTWLHFAADVVDISATMKDKVFAGMMTDRFCKSADLIWMFVTSINATNAYVKAVLTEQSVLDMVGLEIPLQKETVRQTFRGLTSKYPDNKNVGGLERIMVHRGAAASD